MINLEPSLLCLRGDVTSNWITFNPILTLNEPAIEIFNDGNVKMKIGNGVDNFLDLPYLNEADNVNPDWNSTGGLSEILNKPTTVSGYGLSDVYTINEVDFKILTIQEASNSTNGFMSINDFIKLSGVSSGATKNDTDQNLKNRQNHTGTQLSNTISDFVKSVNDSQLSEIYIDNTDVTSGDTVCSSINKLQTQNSNIKSNLSSHVNNVNNPHGVTKYQIDLGSVDNTSDVNKPISISTQNALNLKVDKTTSILAGSGLTGGGALDTNKTIDVGATDDSIIVGENGIKVDTINNLTTISTTKPLSAAQGKALQDNKADKTTNIIAGSGLTGGGDLSADRTINIANADDSLTVTADNVKVNTNNTLTSTSTTQPLSANQGKVLNEKVVQVETDLNYMYPSVGTAKRILTDAGTIKSRSTLNDLTNKFLDLLPNTKLLFCPHLAVKLRESGIYKYVTKLYDVGPAMWDGAQTTALNQPYLSGNIAPTEKYAIKNPNNGNAYLTHTPISFSATDKWSVSTVLDSSGIAQAYQQVYGSPAKSDIRLFPDKILYYNDNGISVSTGIATKNIYGKNQLLTLVASGNGDISSYLNGKIVSTSNIQTNSTFSGLLYSRDYNSINFKGVVSYHCIRDIALSPTQVADEYNYLRTLFPEIESVQIGTQAWATSNCEMTCTPQGNIIPEMQAATNVEKITNGINLIDSNNDGLADGFSTLNNPITSIVTGNGFPGRAQRVEYRSGGGTLQSLTLNNILSPNKLYRLSFKYRASRGYSITDTNAGISSGAVPVNIGDAIDKTIYFKHSGPFTILAFSSWLESLGNWFEIGNITLQEVGWSDSANLYNSIYASTTGTAEQKEYAAVKAAAMWCYYNNDPAIGAIYGKLYNWYAVKLLQMDIDYYNAANPTNPWGWRVPTSDDFNLLSTYLGGDAVSGSKMKKEGFNYWDTPNTGADNNSGFSAIGSGSRNGLGAYSDLKILTLLRTTSDYRFGIRTYTIAIDKTGTSNLVGISLRLIKA